MISRRYDRGIVITAFICLTLALTSCDPVKPTPPRFSETPFFGGIRFNADFDSGSLETLHAIDEHHFRAVPRPEFGKDDWRSLLRRREFRTYWNGKTGWYHFEIKIPESQLPYAIKIEIDRSRESGRLRYSLDKVPVISCDGISWRYVKSWEEQDGVRRLMDTLTCPTTYVAQATPYSWRHMETYLKRLKTHPYVTHQASIAHTPPGHHRDALPLYYLKITDVLSDYTKRRVVVVNGQHPGEVVSSWILQGLIDWLLSEQSAAQTLRKHFEFHIYPMVNPKGVKYGHRRRTPDSPWNPNRAWSTDKVQEISSVRQHILDATERRVDYFFDLHGEMRKQHFIYHFSDQPGAAAFVDEVHLRHPNVADHSTGGEPRNRLYYDAYARWWAMKHLRTKHDPNQPPLSVTIEGSYAQGSWTGKPNQSEELMRLGASLGQSLYEVDLELPHRAVR